MVFINIDLNLLFLLKYKYCNLSIAFASNGKKKKVRFFGNGVS